MSILKIEPAVANSSANFAFGNVFAANYYYANGVQFVGGGGSGTVKYTANTTPPTSNNSPGDQWFNTATQVLYEYINDGTGSAWVDILSPTVSLTGSSLLVNGTSNVTVAPSGNISLNVSSTPNVVKVTTSDVIVTGNVSVTGNFVGNASFANISVANSFTVSNGFYSTNIYNGTFTDGIVVDYLNGNGRISVGAADGLQVYNGGVASNLIFSISPTGVTTVSNSLSVANGISVLGNISSTGNITASGNLTVVGAITMQQTYEVVNTVSSPAGAVTYDYTTGGTYYHTNPTATWVANITNIPTTANRILVVAFIINQGATGYLPSSYQINSSAVTVKWTQGTAPTASNSKIDIISLSCLYVSGSWIVIGQGSSYS